MNGLSPRLTQPLQEPGVMSDPRSVLLVDDNVVNQMVMRTMVEKLGCMCTVVSNGAEAIEQVANHQFDLILMDVQMPVMDGLKATEMIRREEAASGTHTPIVAVTAGVERECCLSAGMDEYLAKPVHTDRLNETMSRIFCNA